VHPALIYLAAAVALLLWARAALRCHREVSGMRTRARTRAQALRLVEQARYRWDAGTAAMAAGLAPLQHMAGTTGFGDQLIAEERLRNATAAAAEASR